MTSFAKSYLGTYLSNIRAETGVLVHEVVLRIPSFDITLLLNAWLLIGRLACKESLVMAFMFTET